MACLKPYNQYPCGRYKYYLGKALESMQLVDGVWSFDPGTGQVVPLNGLVQAKILAPQNE